MVAAVVQYSVGVGGQRLGDQLVPPAEPHQHVDPQRHERFQPVRHRRGFDGQQLGGQLPGEFVGGLQRDRRTALRTSRSRPRSAGRARGTASRSSAALPARRTGDRLAPQPDSPSPSCGSRRTARRCGWACAARWPASGTRSRSRSAAGSASCGVADISMVCRYRCRTMGCSRPAGVASGVVEDPLGLDDPRARRRLAGRGVPQRPRGDVEQRVGGQGLDVDVVGIGLGQRCHGLGVVDVAGVERVGVVRVLGGEAGRQRVDQPASVADARPLAARPSSIRARASDAARSTGSKASHALL